MWKTILLALMLAETILAQVQNADGYNNRAKAMAADVRAENARHDGEVTQLTKKRQDEWAAYLNERIACGRDNPDCVKAAAIKHQKNKDRFDMDENLINAKHQNNLTDIAHKYRFSDIYDASPCTQGGGMPCKGTCDGGTCK